MKLRIFAVLAAVVGAASAGAADHRADAVAHLGSKRAAFGLSQNDTFVARGSRTDAMGVAHVRVDQLHKGVPVFEGEAIYHQTASGRASVTSALRRIKDLDVRPTLSREEGIRAAVDQVAPAGSYAVREARLMVLPRSERNPSRDRLVWRVILDIENAVDTPAEWNMFVDAHSGEVSLSFDSLETSASVGAGKTMYIGDRSVNTNFASGTYSLTDTTRGGGNYTCDMKNRQGGKCATFTRSNNVFGDYSKSNTDRATAAADAHVGLQATWDYYKNTFGRNGIDNAGRKTYSRVHFGSGYENASWNDSCFCMTYGDGASTFYPLVSVDVAGHEMSHGVMSTEANLTYSGESGGLNEANSDIFGTMVEYAVNAPLDTPDYWIGERIFRSNWNGSTYTQTNALRYMDDPAKDGRSPACWYSGVGSLNVHYSSGPQNHFFYLLAEGGTSKCNGNNVAGIGRAKAAAIWYKAVTDYLTASSNYQAARTGALQAATALYGAGSPEYNAVNDAYAAINVQ